MLKVIRQGQRWVTGFFVIAIGAVFVFYLGIGGGGRRSTPGIVVEIGEQAYGLMEFQRVRAQNEFMLQQQLGEQYDARALRDTLDRMAIQALVETAILSEEAKALGFSVRRSARRARAARASWAPGYQPVRSGPVRRRRSRRPSW